MRFHPAYPGDCGQCADWDAEGGWSREQRCKPVCFWEQFDPWAHRMLGLWSRVAVGERVNENTVQYSIDWSAFREFWGGYREFTSPATWEEQRRELADAMVSIRGCMNNPPEAPGGSR